MSILLLKLVLTPLLVGGSALVARRWGPAVGGWLIALPLTSGPVIVFLALDHGPAFARATAVAALGGLSAIVAFCVGYARAARTFGPPAALAVGVVAFAVVGVLIGPLLGAHVLGVAAMTIAAVGIGLVLVRPTGVVHVPVRYPAWDIPARMVVATALVLGITAWAPLLGPAASGVLAVFPVYLAVLTAFTHRQAGAAAAVDVLRGLLGGLIGTAAFYVVFDSLLGPFGLAAAVAAAVVAAMVVGAATLRRVRAAGGEEPARHPAAGTHSGWTDTRIGSRRSGTATRAGVDSSARRRAVPRSARAPTRRTNSEDP